jgi:hypothetical protein
VELEADAFRLLAPVGPLVAGNALHQLPEWPPDIAWPVEPKPPRAAEDVEDENEETEEEDELVLPLWSEELLDANPTEVEFGGRFEVPARRSRSEYELEYQCQPRDELDERRHGSCCTAGCAAGVATPCATACCAGGCWRQFAFEGSM